MSDEQPDGFDSDVDVFALERLRREAIMRRALDKRSTVTEIDAAFRLLAAESSLLANLANAPSEAKLDHFIECFGDIGDRVKHIFDRDPEAISKNPEGAPILIRMLELLEQREGELDIPERERWYGPLEAGRRGKAMIDLEADAQRRARKRSQGDGNVGSKESAS